jgi:hypothetical protein
VETSKSDGPRIMNFDIEGGVILGRHVVVAR